MKSQLITNAGQTIYLLLSSSSPAPIHCLRDRQAHLAHCVTRTSLPSFGNRIARLGSGGAEHVISTANVECCQKGWRRRSAVPQAAWEGLSSRPTADGRCLLSFAAWIVSNAARGTGSAMWEMAVPAGGTGPVGGCWAILQARDCIYTPLHALTVYMCVCLQAVLDRNSPDHTNHHLPPHEVPLSLGMAL